MKIELKRISVRDLVEGYEDNEDLGVIAFDRRLDVRPPYQREFVYKDKQRDAVIETVRKNFPLNVMYWAVQGNDSFEVIDGQQRTISICQYVDGDFSIDINGHQLAFHNLQTDQQEQILDYELMVYLCEGTESEKLDWFETINIAGERLTAQELRNAVYHGPFVSAAKKYFSKNNCPAYQIASDYLPGGLSPIRQDYLELAISWANDGKIDEYMRDHQHDTNADDLWQSFKTIIDWVAATFPKKRSQMRSVKWGSHHKIYGTDIYDPKALEQRISSLMGQNEVRKKSGIYEFLLGGESDTRILEVRVFEDRDKLAAYEAQTQEARASKISNCPLCAIGTNANSDRIYEFDEMDADHVAAWSKGGSTNLANCEMLCITHNRAKGNK
ncbi:HNH endonuclease family protein [Glutamicibacter arilaitensis]|uniref:HNH endonuclease family protein n=1 Tax=Glutamicibacter arilaitensis TaxID=256701 RepID=UPI001868C27D|nr:DUF262 domain-containing protein [Glutamicibacter arilaitensis]